MRSIAAVYTKILGAFSEWINSKGEIFKAEFQINFILPFHWIVSCGHLAEKVESTGKWWWQWSVCPWKPIAIHSSSSKFHPKSHVYHHRICWVCKFVANFVWKKFQRPHDYCSNNVSNYTIEPLSSVCVQLQKDKKWWVRNSIRCDIKITTQLRAPRGTKMTTKLICVNGVIFRFRTAHDGSICSIRCQ